MQRWLIGLMMVGASSLGACTGDDDGNKGGSGGGSTTGASTTSGSAGTGSSGTGTGGGTGGGGGEDLDSGMIPDAGGCAALAMCCPNLPENDDAGNPLKSL